MFIPIIIRSEHGDFVVMTNRPDLLGNALKDDVSGIEWGVDHVDDLMDTYDENDLFMLVAQTTDDTDEIEE